MALIDDVKSYLSISGSSEDSLLTIYINDVKKVIEGYCNGLVYSGSKTQYETYQDLYDSRLYVRAWNTENGTVSVTGRDKPNETWTAVTTNMDYGVLPMVYSEDWSYAQYKIAITAGWSDDDLPADLKGLTIRLAAESFYRQDSKSIHLSQSVKGENGITATTVFRDVISSEQAMATIRKYRFPVC